MVSSRRLAVRKGARGKRSRGWLTPSLIEQLLMCKKDAPAVNSTVNANVVFFSHCPPRAPFVFLFRGYCGGGARGCPPGTCRHILLRAFGTDAIPSVGPTALSLGLSTPPLSQHANVRASPTHLFPLHSPDLRDTIAFDTPALLLSALMPPVCTARPPRLPLFAASLAPSGMENGAR